MPDQTFPEDADTLRKEIERYQLVVGELQSKIRDLEGELNTVRIMAEMPSIVVTRPELRHTLGRLINKVAMIVQAEKVLIMLYQAESQELTILPPALGITEQQANQLAIGPDQGIPGLVYRTGESALYNDALNDPRALPEVVSLLRIRNGICAPLTIKERDEEERVVHERVIGVMHICNKRYEQEFNDDDMRLLEMLAEQAAAVISNAQLYIQLSEEKRRLEQTFETIRAGVIVVSADGDIRLINKAACQMLGLSSDGYEGKPLSEVVTNEQIAELLSNSLQNKDEMQCEVNSEVDQRTYKVETSLMTASNGQIQNVVAIFSDITDIRRVEQMKTAFVSTVSHELRTPLTSIKGFISTLIDDTDGLYDGDTRHEFYDIIDQECDRLTRLINDLLNVSRIESGRALDMQITPIEVRKIAQNVLTTQREYTNSTRHELINGIPEDFPIIQVDADKLSQMLDNLIGNAVKYSPEGGNIVVGGEDEGDTVRIDITDEGLGIPEQYKDKIFERFQMVDDDTTRKAIKGTGIGLYLVRHLARAHSGEVWLAWSEVGKGSTFSVRLPKVSTIQEEAGQRI